MNQSDPINKDHEDRLAKRPPEQRETVFRGTTRLLKRLRLASRFEYALVAEPKVIHVSDNDDLIEW